MRFHISLALYCFLSAATVIAGDDSNQEKIPFNPPEVTIGTFSCNAAWNEFCEDEKTITVPDGYKLCNNKIVESNKSGDASYNIVSSNKTGLTLKFYAKGNRDRFKQESASITLKVSLLGVHAAEECFFKLKPKALQPTPPTAPQIIITPPKVETKPAPELKIESAPVVATPAASQEPKPDACACSQWIAADTVFNCLAKGHGRDNVSCDSMGTTIQCVSSKEECREIQKENCPQAIGLNQTTSKKRIFVPGSPYCQKQ